MSLKWTKQKNHYVRVVQHALPLGIVLGQVGPGFEVAKPNPDGVLKIHTWPDLNPAQTPFGPSLA
jgi:hypothetical protein